MNKFRKMQQEFLENHEQVSDGEIFNSHFKPSLADAAGAFWIAVGLIAFMALMVLFFD